MGATFCGDGYGNPRQNCHPIILGMYFGAETGHGSVRNTEGDPG